jgi:hypothetical protein
LLAAAGLLAVVALVGVGVYLQGGAETQSDPQSSGPLLAALPDVVGMSQDDAQEALEAEGFQVEVQSQESFLRDRGEVIEQSPSGGEAEERSTVEISVGGGPQSAAGYAVVENDSGKLAVEVPSGWSDTITDKDGTLKGDDVDPGEGVGPAITATTELVVWENSNRSSNAPGVYILASKELASYSDDELLTSGLTDLSSSCEAGAPQNFANSLYTGKMQRYSCGADGSVTLRVVAAPADRECVMLAQVLTYSEADREYAQHVLNNFEADCGGIS